MGNRVKISVIGAGNVGASCAQRLAEKGFADIVMLDIVEGLPQGKALDIQESAPINGFDFSITGTNDYKDTANSDIVVITSGAARKPGMTRDDLLKINMKIISDVTGNVARYSPDCIIMIATNPVDAMVYLALEVSKFPRNRVMGLSGVLDGGRLRTFIAEELKVSAQNITACVLGEHGKSMVVIPRLTMVDGVPLTQLLSPEKIKSLIERTVGGGAEIVGLLKTGSAFYAPSAALASMVEAVIMDSNKILGCGALLDGEYGITDTVLDVPVKLNRNGIEQIIELNLTEDEKENLLESAKAVQGLIKAMKP